MAKDWTQDETIRYLERLLDYKDAEIERLREALKPFADVVKENGNEQSDDMPMSYGFGVDKRFDLTLGDFRKARSALQQKDTE